MVTVAGLLTCFAAGLLALLLVPFKKFSSRTGLFVAAFGAPLPGQSLLWLVVPTFHLLGRQWQHSAIDFAQQSGFHPVLVALIGLALTVLGLKVFLRRTQFTAKFKATLDQMQATDAGPTGSRM